MKCLRLLVRPRTCYEEFIGAKKHLVVGVLSHAGPPPESNCIGSSL
jgi:hypothetical protein